ncbi:MAG: flagellar biosynthesis regulator FlaF [Azospirillaceae bacterium]
MGYDSYRSAQRRTATPTQTEYQVLADMTGRLMSIEDVRSPEAARILHENIQIWQTFSDDLMQEGNPLPDQLKAQLISLALWVGRHSRQVMRNGASIAPLIDVNKSIMAGLAQQATAAQAAQATPAPRAPAGDAASAMATLRRSA